MRVLIVDDEDDHRHICRVALTASGHDVIEARDGEEGLFVAVAERPDVIVLDLRMRVRGGVSVLEEKRALPEISGTPVIVLSAVSNSMELRRALDAGANLVITKPFTPATLVRRLESIEPEPTTTLFS